MYNENNRRLQCTTDNIFYIKKNKNHRIFTAASISNIDFDIHKQKNESFFSGLFFVNFCIIS